MYKLEGKRNGCVIYQDFRNWNEANERSKWLATQGFVVSITRTQAS